MSNFITHHATAHGTAEHSSRRHSLTSSVASLVHHRREDQGVELPSEDEELQAERRLHRSDLVEERPEGDLPASAFRVEPAAPMAPSIARLKEGAGQSSSSLGPEQPSMGSRSSSAQRLQAAARRITAARIFLNEDDWDNPRTPGLDPNRVDLPSLKADVVIQAVDCSREVSRSSTPRKDGRLP